MLRISCNNFRMISVLAMVFCSQQVLGQEKDPCESSNACIGMVIDSGDPVLIQMGQEMSKLVTDKQAGTVV